MSAILEQYFQAIVVEKINETISRQFDEIKEDLDGLKKIQSDYVNLRIEIENLKKRVSDSGNEIKEILAKSSKKQAPAKTKVAAKPVAKKSAVKKLAVKKKKAKK